MEIQILGPLVLSHGGRVSTPTAPKPRSVLGLLLLNHDKAVPVSSLIQDLWGASPPASALTTLQTYILQVRKCLRGLLDIPLSEVAERVLVTVPSGYQLSTCGVDFDLRSFDQLASTGRRALAAGDNVNAAALLSRACTFWRGPVLADVRAGAVAEPQLKALEQVRLNTLEQSIEARMRLGQHQDVLAELTLLLGEHGLNENLCALLMVALHRSGQRREALAVFHRLRQSMIEELGLEPGKRLQGLHQAILTDDEALEVAPRDDGLVHLLDHLSLQRARAS